MGYRDGRLSFDALQRRMSSQRRISHGADQAARLAQTEPASLVGFDVMLDAAVRAGHPGWRPAGEGRLINTLRIPVTVKCVADLAERRASLDYARRR